MKTITTPPPTDVDARLSALRRGPSRVDREQHVIYGVALVQSGPLNEGDERPWYLDGTSLAQVFQLVGLTGLRGLKARFTHPNMSRDGLGTYLGRFHNARLSNDGRTVLADLHLADIAFRNGRGAYVEDLAESDPEAFGVSLAPVLDRAEMDRLQTREGKQPMRFRKLIAADVVDEPAATRGGFFGGQQLSIASAPAYATAALDELFPGDAPASVIRERATAFLESYLSQRKPASGGAEVIEGLTMAAVTAAIESTVKSVSAELSKSLDERLAQFTPKQEQQNMTSTLSAPLAEGIELASFTGDEAKAFESLRSYCDEYVSQIKTYTDAKLTLAEYVSSRMQDDGRRVTPAMASAMAKQSAIVQERFPLLDCATWLTSAID